MDQIHGGPVDLRTFMGCASSKETGEDPLHPAMDAAKSSSSLPICYLDVAFDGQVVGRILLELRPDIVPKTVENFIGLCKRADGYKGTTLHRIIPGFMAQGGSCGMSIFGKRFEDESFELKHEGRGILSMANSGADTNNTQFFITFKDTPHLDGKHVVFGKVVQGMEVVDKLESVGSRSGATSLTVTIHDCGELQRSK
eukprot:TRINITY_DN8774_c0_g1_i1.p1 TRINITY_DN8774_c0_g1~~TRINITY_DN8774_c0_g1_i1.p1  ORF type:complete len:198 (+),score=24.26 TRINITY_DN8774_c0_g1_i1:14-607(+)